MMSLILTEKFIERARRAQLYNRGPSGEIMHGALVKPERAEPMALGWKRWRITATTDAWETLAAWALSMGASRPGDPSDRHQEATWFRNTAGKIDRELSRLAKHPGYRGIAVVGDSAIVLPAYKLPSDDRYWPSTRRALAQAARLGESEVLAGELVPVRVKLRNRVFTRWTFCSSTSAREALRGSPQR